jgi:predicted RNase H-related nuclease YkuK (DUF458 family)
MRLKTWVQAQMSEWRCLKGLPKDLRAHFELFLRKGYKIHVGCDSQQYSDYTRIVSVICFRKGPNGVITYRKSKKEQPSPSVYLKLQREVLEAIKIAQFVASNGFEDITVHLDINPDDKYLSNKFYKEFVNMVTGCGYKCITKPDAFAASIADMFTRGENGKDT